MTHAGRPNLYPDLAWPRPKRLNVILDDDLAVFNGVEYRGTHGKSRTGFKTARKTGWAVGFPHQHVIMAP